LAWPSQKNWLGLLLIRADPLSERFGERGLEFVMPKKNVGIEVEYGDTGMIDLDMVCQMALKKQR